MKSFRILIIYVVASCLVIACNLDEIPDNTGSGSNFEASFDHTDSCNTPFEVIFTNTSSFQGDSFLWDFGDTGSPDNTSALEHPSHIYSGPGTYTVELTVDSSGTSSVFSMNIDVELITFERTFGGGVMDSATAVVQAPDGGFFITGYSKSKGNDILIYKTNRCNDDLIYTSVGGTGSSYGNSISLTNDGGYLIAGRHSYFGHSGYVVKLNSSGNSVQALENSEIKTYAAIQLNNNDIIIAGSKKTTDGFYDSRLFKTNGNLVGLTEFTGSGGYMFTNEFFELVDIGGQSVAAVGTIWVGFGYRIYFVSANYSFSINYTLSIDKIVGDNSIVGTSLAMTEDEGFVITGWFNNVFDPDPSATYLKKISSTGSELWETDFTSGTGIIGQNEPTKVIACSDGGFVILGNHKLDATSDIFIVKTDSNGNYLWDKSYGGSGFDFGNDIIELEEGGFLIVGYTESFNSSGEQGNVYILKTDENGDIQS